MGRVPTLAKSARMGQPRGLAGSRVGDSSYGRLSGSRTDPAPFTVEKRTIAIYRVCHRHNPNANKAQNGRSANAAGM